jgi:cysteine protease ATG4
MENMMAKAREKAKDLLEASLNKTKDDHGDGSDHDARQLLPMATKTNETASISTTAAAFGRAVSTAPPHHDLAKAAGYKYDHGNSTEGTDAADDDDEDVYFPNDAEEETTKTRTDKGDNAWKTKVFCTVVQKMSPQQKQKIPYVYVLGSILHPIHDFTKRKELEQSLFWFTYRFDFKEIKPYGITTDAGWGCMLRSAQMMLAHTLRLHFTESSKLTHNTKTNTAFNNRLLTWFVDIPSNDRCFYSLHNMCAAGLANHQVLPGEWYGPGTACYVLRDLVAMHQEQQPATPLFRVHVATDGTVYRQSIEELMTRDGRKRRQEQEEKQEQQPYDEEDTKLPAHPLDPLAIHAETSSTTTDVHATLSITPPMEWDTSLLLLVPLRLGLNNFHPDYVKSLARTFALPQSVGVLGGRPRGARWFFGALADGSKVLGLDPHTVQPALTSLPRGGSDSPVSLPEEFLASVHSQYPDTFDLARMDPSIALGFYCRTRRDLESLEYSLKEIDKAFAKASGTNKALSSSQQLVVFMDRAPNYEDNFLSEEANGMMMNDDEEDMLIGGKLQCPKAQAYLDDDDDEDDFVFL